MSPEEAPGRVERSYFEDLYEHDPDPWRFETSAYERDKYAHALATLGRRHFKNALEVGCSIGVFTEQLASVCGDLLAVDLSDHAVAATRARVRHQPWVQVQRRTLPEETPAGPFHLIVCSEVLYYWPEALLEVALERFAGALAPGGLLLAVHYTERTRTYPLQGRRVHDLLLAHPRFTPLRGEDRARYRLDLLERT